MSLAHKFELDRLLLLRKQGKSFPWLAKEFGIDYSTAIYHCHRHHAFPPGITAKKVHKKPLIRKDAVRKAEGKSYLDLLKEAESRPSEKFYKERVGYERNYSYGAAY